MNPNNTPLGKRENLVVQEIDNEVLVYDLVENKAFCLNHTSSLVWQLCDGKTSVTEISQKLTKKLKSPANEDLVWFAIEQLKKENLIANSKSMTNPFVGMSRREVIKKVGLGSMVALPVVASLVAPMGFHAQSCVGVNGVCTTTANCCPGSPTLTCNNSPVGTTPSSMACCQGAGFIPTGSSATYDNPFNNCASPSLVALNAQCNANCCSATATGTLTSCNGGPTGVVVCGCA